QRQKNRLRPVFSCLSLCCGPLVNSPMVPRGRIELPLLLRKRILNPPRLPIPPPRLYASRAEYTEPWRPRSMLCMVEKAVFRYHGRPFCNAGTHTPCASATFNLNCPIG